MPVATLKPRAWKGVTIRNLRRWFGLSQEEFADAIGAHRATVIRWEGRTSGPLPGSAEAAVMSALSDVRDLLERGRGSRAKSWLDAQIPALGGRTPRESLASGPRGVLRVRDVVREDWEGVY
jgi:transcriptional regulator with XRE-family HTH domain